LGLARIIFYFVLLLLPMSINLGQTLLMSTKDNRGKPINKPWWIFVGPFIQIKRHFCAKKYFLIIKFLLKLIFCWWLDKFIQLAF
jgi:hypothetical protein